ncbi:hypothetical protein WJX72_000557 [[Myrmecia] bisecta]|uniref:Uncharacterized protein n=1 Tax=[Myrmecia] bisecta TaxID=41462 RepID=A0AAW1Q1U1_9CHLO
MLFNALEAGQDSTAASGGVDEFSTESQWRLPAELYGALVMRLGWGDLTQNAVAWLPTCSQQAAVIRSLGTAATAPWPALLALTLPGGVAQPDCTQALAAVVLQGLQQHQAAIPANQRPACITALARFLARATRGLSASHGSAEEQPLPGLLRTAGALLQDLLAGLDDAGMEDLRQLLQRAKPLQAAAAHSLIIVSNHMIAVAEAESFVFGAEPARVAAIAQELLPFAALAPEATLRRLVMDAVRYSGQGALVVEVLHEMPALACYRQVALREALLPACARVLPDCTTQQYIRIVHMALPPLLDAVLLAFQQPEPAAGHVMLHCAAVEVATRATYLVAFAEGFAAPAVAECEGPSDERCAAVDALLRHFSALCTHALAAMESRVERRMLAQRCLFEAVELVYRLQEVYDCSACQTLMLHLLKVLIEDESSEQPTITTAWVKLQLAKVDSPMQDVLTFAWEKLVGDE